MTPAVQRRRYSLLERGLRIAASIVCSLWMLAAVSGCQKPPAATDAGTPQRIVSQTIDTDEILWGLGPTVRARVVGVSKLTDDVRYSPNPGRWSDEVPRVPGNSEALIAANPDLVLIASFSAAETRALLEQTGITTLKLSAYSGFDDYRKRVRRVAKAVQAPDQGERLVAEFDRKLKVARSAVSALSSAQQPTIVSWISGGVAGKGTSFDDIAQAGGYRNLAAVHDVQGYKTISLEQLMTWAPDYIVIQCGLHDCARREHEFSARPGIVALAAAREGHIIAVPGAILSAAGPTMLEASKRLADRRSP